MSRRQEFLETRYVQAGGVIGIGFAMVDLLLRERHMIMNRSLTLM
jgi:hypothetical protein